MKKQTAHIKQLLTAKGFSSEHDKENNRLVCSAEDTYGVVFYIFKTEAEAIEISSLHSLYVVNDFLEEAKEIVSETNRNMRLGSFHINETGHITFSATYKTDEENELSIEEVCEAALRTNTSCRQAIFENMMCEMSEQ